MRLYGVVVEIPRKSYAAYAWTLGNYTVVSSIIAPRNSIAKLDFCPPPLLHSITDKILIYSVGIRGNCIF